MDDDVQRLTAFLAAHNSTARRRTGRRSNMSYWMDNHRKDFEAMLAESRPSWAVVAEGLAELGVRDGKDQAPSPERVRKAWWAACRRAEQLAGTAAAAGTGSKSLLGESLSSELQADVLVTGGKSSEKSTSRRVKAPLNTKDVSRLKHEPNLQDAAPDFETNSSGLAGPCAAATMGEEDTTPKLPESETPCTEDRNVAADTRVHEEPATFGGLAEATWDRWAAAMATGSLADPVVPLISALRKSAAAVKSWLEAARMPREALGIGLVAPWPPMHRASAADPASLVWTETGTGATTDEARRALFEGWQRLRDRQGEWEAAFHKLKSSGARVRDLDRFRADILTSCEAWRNHREREVAFGELAAQRVYERGADGFFELWDTVPHDARSAEMPGGYNAQPARWQWDDGGLLRDCPEVATATTWADTSNAEATTKVLLAAGGLSLLGRFARSSQRLAAFARLGNSERVLPGREARARNSRASVLSGLRPTGTPPAVLGVGRVLSQTERLELFGHGPQAPGSAGETGLSIPAGSVIVMSAGEPAYLRGRGWRIGPERQVVAWSNVPEPDLVAGVDATGVALGASIHWAGMRWTNVEGDGWLWDETALEWEDRRLRLRAQVAARLQSGAELSASEWRWALWSVMGHCGSAADWRLAEGDWRWPAGSSPEGESTVSKRVRYVAGRRTQNGEWAAHSHDELWMRWAGLRGGTDVPDLLEQWLTELRETTARRQLDRTWQEAHDLALREMLGGLTARQFWDEERAAARSARKAEHGFQEAVVAHRTWMRGHARVALLPNSSRVTQEVTPPRAISVEAWSEDFAPESLLVPTDMIIADAPSGLLHDFSGGRYPPPPLVADVEARCFGTGAPPGLAVPLRMPPGSSLPGDPSEAVIADANALRLDATEMDARYRRIFGEAHELLFGDGATLLWPFEGAQGSKEDADHEVDLDPTATVINVKRPEWPVIPRTQPKPSCGRFVDRRGSASAFFGLVPEQALFLELALDGRSILFTGPGGSGKTSVLRRFAELKAQHGDGTYLAVVTPDAGSSLGETADVFRPWDAARLAGAAEHARKASRSCLVIDEHSSATPAVLNLSETFDQVILAGDPAQGTYGVASVVAKAWLMRRDPVALGASVLWRASRRGQFATLNALAYGGQHEAFGGGSRNKPGDDVRWRSADSGFASALLMAARGVRYAGLGTRGTPASVAVVVKSHAALLVFVDGMTRRLMRDAPRPRLLSPTRLVGMEAEILIADLGRSLPEDASERLTVLLLGRPRFRLEFVRAQDSSWLPGLLAWAFEAGGQVDGVASRLVEALGRRGLMVAHGRSHLAVYNTLGSRPLRLFVFDGSSVRGSLARQTTANAKNWSTTMVSPAELCIEGAAEYLADGVAKEAFT